MRLQRRVVLIGVLAAGSALVIVRMGAADSWPPVGLVCALAFIALVGALASHYLIRCPHCHRRAGLRAGPGVRCRHCSQEY